MVDRQNPPTRTGVFCVRLTKELKESNWPIDLIVQEAIGLAQALELDVVLSEFFKLSKAAPATLIGSGHVESLHGQINELDLELVVIDGSLTPIQQRNLEKKWGVKVIDRTGLILEIFAKRARTAEGRLQVELAALTYQRSRLVKSWSHLERQRGGFGFTGGPGESQLELDRRMIDERVIKIKIALNKTIQTRELHRKKRLDKPYPVVALVGYTNAGKSTLFNKLTGADVLAKDLLFATLDPTIRQVKLPGGQDIMLCDTVGFISHLPTHLVAAFKATLEEVTRADLILHVHDASHPAYLQQSKDVEGILTSLGITHAIRTEKEIHVYNKIDLLEEKERQALLNKLSKEDDSLCICATTGENLDKLLQHLNKKLREGKRTLTIKLDPSEGAVLSWCYRQGLIKNRTDQEDGIFLNLLLTNDDYCQLNHLLGNHLKQMELSHE